MTAFRTISPYWYSRLGGTQRPFPVTNQISCDAIAYAWEEEAKEGSFHEWSLKPNFDLYLASSPPSAAEAAAAGRGCCRSGVCSGDAAAACSSEARARRISAAAAAAAAADDEGDLLRAVEVVEERDMPLALEGRSFEFAEFEKEKVPET